MIAPLCPGSERGIALITVLLMMAVLSGLATGFAMNGHTESTMAKNEVYYAGARAAAEAGMNRAIESIVNNTVDNLLAGPDGETSATADDEVNDDNGDISFLIGSPGPYPLDPEGLYSYTIEVLDDDDPRLYQEPLSDEQKESMKEHVTDSPHVDDNNRLILRVTGFGPRNTVVRIMRELQSVDSTTEFTTTTTTAIANPAILVNGNLAISGNVFVQGDYGNVHTNGNLTISGNANIAGDATATGSFASSGNAKAGGAKGGNRDAITVPDVQAENYESYADYILTSAGGFQYGPSHPAVVAGTQTAGSVCTCPNSGWSFSGGRWSASGHSAMVGTFYVQTSASVSGNLGKKGAELPFSVIAVGSLEISGNVKLKPDNDAKYQFVTNGDLRISGNAGLDDATAVEGQILVREQFQMSGNPEFQGRILVQNAPSVFNDLTSNSITGNAKITYIGTLNAEPPSTTSTVTTYTNNVRGWIEQ